MIGDRGDLKNIEFGEGYCRLGDEEITLCHECIGRKVCWNAQIGGNYATARLARENADRPQQEIGQVSPVRDTAPDSPGEKTE